MDPWVGHTLNERFRVEAALGRGGMAAVYRASDLRLGGRPVVVKHPLREDDRAGGLSDEELRRRFASEVARLIQLDDVPNVVPILDQGVHEGTPFYVMRYMAGGSLAGRLEGGPQAPEEALAWLVPIADALDRLHRRGVLHRDVKPDNLLFDHPRGGAPDGEPRAHLADFGIVKELQAAWATTGQNTAIGTPGFMAPEQLLPDAEPDGRADQYALAATLYTALTGRPPQYEATGADAGTGRKRLRPVHAPDLAPHVPAAVSEVVARALDREPSRRFDTCRAFAAAFGAALRGTAPAPARPVAPATRKAAPREAEAQVRGAGGAAAPRDADAARRRAGPLRRAATTLLLAALAAGAFAGWRAWQDAQDRGSRPATGAPPPAPPGPKTEGPPRPPVAPDREAPVVTITQPAEPALVTTAEKVVVVGSVRESGGPLSGVRLVAGADAVALDAAGAFRVEVPLALDEERTLRLVATDAAANASEPAVRTLKREAPWAAALRDALAALAREDGEAVKAALARPEAKDVPLGSAAPLLAFVKAWDQEPAILVTSLAPTPDAPPPGEPRAVRVVGSLATGRKGDRVFVDGRDATVPPNGFEVVLRRPAPGRVDVPYEIRSGSEVRKRGTLAVTFEAPAPTRVALAPNAMFHRFDLDGDGGLVAGEFPGAPEGFQALDANHDGRLDPREIEDGESAVARAPTASQVTAALEQLRLPDFDGTGRVSKEAHPEVARLDNNGDGFLDVGDLRLGATPPWARVSHEQLVAAVRVNKPVAFENALGMRFVIVPPGTFVMGSPPTEADRLPFESRRTVTLTKPVWLQITEVSTAEFRRWRPGHALAKVGGTGSWSRAYALDDPPQPVVNVLAKDARDFAAWVQTKTVGADYRLPTEAEWECACRAGTQGLWWWGDDASVAGACANVPDLGWDRATWKMGDAYIEKFGFAVDDGHVVSAPVGSYRPNPWGLYDMLGNVWEICADWGTVLPATAAVDPRVPTDPGGDSPIGQGLGSAELGHVLRGPGAVIKGGCWAEHRWALRAAARTSLPTDRALDVVGFRLAADVR